MTQLPTRRNVGTKLIVPEIKILGGKLENVAWTDVASMSSFLDLHDEVKPFQPSCKRSN